MSADDVEFDHHTGRDEAERRRGGRRVPYVPGSRADLSPGSGTRKSQDVTRKASGLRVTRACVGSVAPDQQGSDCFFSLPSGTLTGWHWLT